MRGKATQRLWWSLIWDIEKENSFIRICFSRGNRQFDDTHHTMRALGWPCACVWLPGHWRDVNNYLGDFGGHGTRAWVAGKRRWEIHHSWIWDCPLLSRLSANEHLVSIFGASEGTLRLATRDRRDDLAVTKYLGLWGRC